LDLNNDFHSQVPVWIRLPELPLEYWHEDVFDGIARTFGELLSIDPVTAAKKRLNYARICVGVNEGQDMPQVLELQSRLGNRSQKIDYESVPFACFHCKKAGHKAGSCPLFKGKRTGGEARQQGGKKDSLDPKKEWRKKAMQVKANGEAEGKTNNATHVPQEESRLPRAAGNAGEEEEKGEADDPSSPPRVKETEKNPEETGNNKIQTPLDSQEDDLKLSFDPKSMEGLKEGEPTPQDPNPNPECLPPSTVNRILERLSAATMEDLAKIDAWLDKGLDGEETPWKEVRSKKKKSSRDPSPVSPPSTRSKAKADLGHKPNPVGRKNKNEIRKEEARRNIMDGTQRTIQEACSVVKS
jgi:hypothetical protein